MFVLLFGIPVMGCRLAATSLYHKIETFFYLHIVRNIVRLIAQYNNGVYMHRIQLDKDIQPLSEFRSKVAFYFDKVKKTKRSASHHPKR